MGSGTTLRRYAVALLMLVGVALVGMGCSNAPTHSPKEFLGKWYANEKQPPNTEVLLDFRADGTGMSKLNWYPHEQSVRWLLVRNKLVISSMDGSGTDEYDYRFDGPDHLFIRFNGIERPFARAK